MWKNVPHRFFTFNDIFATILLAARLLCLVKEIFKLSFENSRAFWSTERIWQ